NVEPEEPKELLYSAERASSWEKMVRVVGQCIKFINICREKVQPGQLLAADIKQAEKFIV
uniref:Uncharacterized protein n=1 Tax=Panagrolaimus sp. ES5 TaxID=591445 RepID=A0AC34FZM3_9BILA